ncbi:C2H2-type zinc finger family protein [Striga hermonthica]|uniref:C2H2-type zinc finger family protein n=1 Tax=Striga hermonthica TaxID=68872 RepID=A0A9N7N1K7_STRHE|nr:C2H2-type zinc finger family protein [Striga hermonthica]
MACIDDQQPNFKHYCRVCKKGFICGRALGGHMRAHGIGDESGNLDDDPISDWEEKFGGGVDRTSNKRMYQLRTNPNRLKSCRTCENCGKEFLSWKSFLEHGKCNSDDASESPISSAESDAADEDDDGTHVGNQWSKRKRTLRSKVGCFNATSYQTSEEDDIMLARCLVQLANTVVVNSPTVDQEESCASVIRETAEERQNGYYTYFTPPKSTKGAFNQHKGKAVISTNSRGMFECKACKKVFNSHQALGGHRASHKKVKGCYAARQNQIVLQQDENNGVVVMEDDTITNNEEFLIAPSKLSTDPSGLQFEQGPPLVGAARRKSKVHECSICHRVFSSGQALGGHKRCHWITSNSPETSSFPKFHFQDNTKNYYTNEQINHHNHQHEPTIDKSDKLDLNVPAWGHASVAMHDTPDPLNFNASTNMQLQSWIGPDFKNIDTDPHCPSQGFQLKNEDYKINDDIIESNNVNGTVETKSGTTRCIEDEADSRLIKLTKLSDLNDLKEMDNGGSSSQWLQVGIGSTNGATTDV